MNIRLKLQVAVVGALALSATAMAQFPANPTGWNLGNTLEAVPTEGSWGPAATQALINSVAAHGYNVIRVPVSWDIHANSHTHVIDPAWMARVTTVVNWCLAANLTTIIDCHWDNGWFDSQSFNRFDRGINTKVQSYWTQIATNFKNTDGRLIFDVANEPAASTQAQTNILFQYYQTFVNAVRGVGGQNSTRWLVYPAPSTNMGYAYTLNLPFPTDPAGPGHVILDVHCYDPFQFTGLTSDANWGAMFYFWGAGYHSSTLTNRNATWGEEAWLDGQIANMRTKYVSQGIPVIFGEFEASPKPSEPDLTPAYATLNYNSCTYWDYTVFTKARNYGVTPIFWNIAGQVFNWTTGNVTDNNFLTASQGKGYLPPPNPLP